MNFLYNCALMGKCCFHWSLKLVNFCFFRKCGTFTHLIFIPFKRKSARLLLQCFALVFLFTSTVNTIQRQVLFNTRTVLEIGSCIGHYQVETFLCLSATTTLLLLVFAHEVCCNMPSLVWKMGGVSSVSEALFRSVLCSWLDQVDQFSISIFSSWGCLGSCMGLLPQKKSSNSG